VTIAQTVGRARAHDARVVAIVSSVIKLANDLGLEVVAEGVETPEQARILGELGCNLAQGYLWAAAMPFDALDAQLRGRRPRVVGLARPA
jgi:EAL domain-containing protein (putative c-di-GMP-specific phosphodiesterase class I)